MPRESSTVRRAASTHRAGHHGDKSTHVDEASVMTVGPNDNVFAALNLPDADEWLAKAELARAIQRLIGTLGLTQMQAAAAIGGAQSDIRVNAR